MARAPRPQSNEQELVLAVQAAEYGARHDQMLHSQEVYPKTRYPKHFRRASWILPCLLPNPRKIPILVEEIRFARYWSYLGHDLLVAVRVQVSLESLL